MPAALADRLGHAVEVRSVADAELLRRRERPLGHQRVGQVRLRVLLLGVQEVPGEPDVGVRADRVEPFVERGPRRRDQLGRALELAAMDRTDRVGRGPDRTARGGQGPFAGRGLRVEALVQGVGERIEVHAGVQAPAEAAADACRTTTCTGSCWPIAPSPLKVCRGTAAGPSATKRGARPGFGRSRNGRRAHALVRARLVGLDRQQQPHVQEQQAGEPGAHVPDDPQGRHEPDQQRQDDRLDQDHEHLAPALTRPRPLPLLGAEEPNALAGGDDPPPVRSVYLRLRQQLHPVFEVVHRALAGVPPAPGRDQECGPHDA